MYNTHTEKWQFTNWSHRSASTSSRNRPLSAAQKPLPRGSVNTILKEKEGRKERGEGWPGIHFKRKGEMLQRAGGEPRGRSRGNSQPYWDTPIRASPDLLKTVMGLNRPTTRVTAAKAGWALEGRGFLPGTEQGNACRCVPSQEKAGSGPTPPNPPHPQSVPLHPFPKPGEAGHPPCFLPAGCDSCQTLCQDPGLWKEQHPG